MLKIMLLLFISLPVLVKAQGNDYFISNNRQVNIQAFNEQVKQIMDDIGVPGVSLAVIENNKIVFSNTYGFRQLQPLKRANRHTVFEACSLSKGYLVYVVYKLVDEGKLDLDKPMYQYMPYEPLEHDQRYKLITPRIILSHCSGMENWKQHNNKDTLEILSTPGEKYTYSGEAYNYLAKVVGLLLHEPYEQYIEQVLFKPLDLQNSFVQFKKKNGLFHKESPWNYAMGYRYFGQEVSKWKNYEPVPSSANNVTAEDYAKLIIGIFDKKHLSEKSINTILEPHTLVRKTADNTYYYGNGFEVFYVAGDTIIVHGGSNPGYKSEIFYSVVNKRGFVFFSNSDRGRMMTVKLSEMTAGLDISKYFDLPVEHQYPSTPIALLKIYRDKNGQAMMEEVERLKREGKMDINTWNELGFVFTEKDTAIAMKLLEESYRLNPKHPDVNCLLGDLYWERGQFDVALQYYLEAKELNFDLWEIKPAFLQEVRDKITETAMRKSRLVTIRDNSETKLEAEDYSNSRGIGVKPTADTGGGLTVNYIEAGDWMDYNVNVTTPGIYSVEFRIACLKGKGQIQLLSGTSPLASVKVPATEGWEKWETITTHIQLPAGTQTLRLYAVNGGFDINWLQLSRTGATVSK
jgi:CubicO group peptidase (beta-lactamase class C family)